MKKCNECKKEKPLEDFSKNKSRKDGLNHMCKECYKNYYKANKKQIAKKNKEYRENNKEQIAAQHKEYRENNKETIAEYQKNYRENNKEEIAEYRESNKEQIAAQQKRYYENNKEQIVAQHKEYRENNKETIAEYQKNYRENNKEEIAEYQKEYQKDYRKNNKEKIAKQERKKLQTNVNYKLASRLRSRLSSAIQTNQKQGSAVRDLGCSIQFLKEYLEKQFRLNMSWDNYGEVWHIDHIIPLCAFNLTDRFQLCAACYYENLQPLFVEENLQKGSSYKQEDYNKYLKYFTKIR